MGEGHHGLDHWQIVTVEEEDAVLGGGGKLGGRRGDEGPELIAQGGTDLAGASGALGRTPVTTAPAVSRSWPAAVQAPTAAWRPRAPAVSQRPTAIRTSARERMASTAGPPATGRSTTITRYAVMAASSTR